MASLMAAARCMVRAAQRERADQSRTYYASREWSRMLNDRGLPAGQRSNRALCVFVPGGLQQLDSIAEGVEHVDPMESSERFVRDRREPRRPATGGDLGQAAHEHSWVRLARRSKVRLYPEVKPQSAAAEPHAASHGQVWRLLLLDEPEYSGIERARHLLGADRHGDLHVVESDDFTHAEIVSVRRDVCQFAPRLVSPKPQGAKRNLFWGRRASEVFEYGREQTWRNRAGRSNFVRVDQRCALSSQHQIRIAQAGDVLHPV